MREFCEEARRDLRSVLVLDLSPGELLLFEGGGHVGVAEAGQMFDHHCVQLEVELLDVLFLHYLNIIAEHKGVLEL